MSVTALVADPPKLPLIVIFKGLVYQSVCRLYFPPPLFLSVPTSVPVQVTYACKVTVALELNASTRNCFRERTSVGGGVVVGGANTATEIHDAS